MQCVDALDCGGCDRAGSRAVCVDGGCACTLAKPRVPLAVLMLLTVALACGLAWMRSGRPFGGEAVDQKLVWRRAGHPDFVASKDGQVGSDDFDAVV